MERNMNEYGNFLIYTSTDKKSAHDLADMAGSLLEARNKVKELREKGLSVIVRKG